jgi:hypothetical protein
MPETVTEEKAPSKEAVAKAKQRATEHLAGLKKVAHLQRTSAMEIGLRAFEMKENSEFAVLGMEEDECRELVGMERSNWYRLIQIRSGLKNLPKKRFLSLYSGKAYQICRLSEKDRYRDVWLDRAADPKLTEAALTEMIDAKLETGELKTDATSVEERVWLKIRMYKKAFDMVKQKLDAFCHEHGLGDDYGEALSIIVTDKGDDALKNAVTDIELEMLRKVRAALQEKMPELKATVELLKDAHRPAEDRCKAFEKAATGFITELAKAAGLKSKGASA